MYLNVLKSSIKYLIATTFLVVLISNSFLRTSALSASSLTLSDSRPSQSAVSYTFNASSFSTGTTIRCINLQLNDAADGTGAIPTGITTTSSTLASSSLITAGSWTVNNGSNGRLRITNAGGETPAASGNVVWGAVTNGSSAGTTYYGIFTTYTDASCTGGNEVDSVTVAFIYVNGTLVQLTIDPTLTFTVAAVGSGQAVNGATTTVASGATSIDFLNDVTFAAKGVSAHDIQVGTNATGGYVVYIRNTGQLTNGSDNIAYHTGTNAVPTAFPAAGTEAWGYTTEDSNLAGGTADRFTNPGNLWAGFSTTNALVVDNTTAPSGTETTRVGHQVGVSSGTPAGTYQTTLIYTVVSTY
ncbi:hypothetical protein KC960_01225 [Candidatus Saccharibacteria bacterium]|nr:hypothetical protein [Candidatus Saccharibacteria bacterium]